MFFKKKTIYEYIPFGCDTCIYKDVCRYTEQYQQCCADLQKRIEASNILNGLFPTSITIQCQHHSSYWHFPGNNRKD